MYIRSFDWAFRFSPTVVESNSSSLPLASSSFASPSSDLKNPARGRCFLPASARLKGLKLGAVLRIAFLKRSWAGCMAWIRPMPEPKAEPSSSGMPSMCRKRSLVNTCSKAEISLRESEDGGRGSWPRRACVAMIERSSSSWISGKLRNFVG